jgi:hypothetical protein
MTRAEIEKVAAVLPLAEYQEHRTISSWAMARLLLDILDIPEHECMHDQVECAYYIALQKAVANG